MLEYDPKGFLRRSETPIPPQPSAHGHIWTFRDELKAVKVADLLTTQNRAGRQAKGCEPRQFRARGRELWAEPMR